MILFMVGCCMLFAFVLDLSLVPDFVVCYGVICCLCGCVFFVWCILGLFYFCGVFFVMLYVSCCFVFDLLILCLLLEFSFGFSCWCLTCFDLVLLCFGFDFWFCVAGTLFLFCLFNCLSVWADLLLNISLVWDFTIVCVGLTYLLWFLLCLILFWLFWFSLRLFILSCFGCWTRLVVGLGLRFVFAIILLIWWVCWSDGFTVWVMPIAVTFEFVFFACLYFTGSCFNYCLLFVCFVCWLRCVVCWF